ncbi:hypothetical protein NQ317_014180 [Molorchus minor]|uniref:CCHC-type domain-containing protein n=1 Tax=Molorchus minor TaxID=1323400 RepID=A0ABQ9JKW2_9CUCU|nr:hypothetical protein NQ317_014180 [Molorchus minor]
MSLLNICGNISGREAVSCTIHGLQDDHVKTAARAGNYSEPEGLFTYLRTLQTTNFRPKDSKWENRKVFETKFRQTSELSKSAEVKCFKCGKTGHKSFQCKLNGNKVCSFCHKKGHEESRCFFKRDGKSTTPTSKESTL